MAISRYAPRPSGRGLNRTVPEGRGVLTPMQIGQQEDEERRAADPWFLNSEENRTPLQPWESPGLPSELSPAPQAVPEGPIGYPDQQYPGQQPFSYPGQGGQSNFGGMGGIQWGMPQTPMMQNPYGGYGMGGFGGEGFGQFLQQLMAMMQQQGGQQQGGQQQARRVSPGGGMVQGDNSFMNRLFY